MRLRCRLWWRQTEVLRQMPQSENCWRYPSKMAKINCSNHWNRFRISHCLPCNLPLVGFRNRSYIGRYDLRLLLVFDILRLLQAMRIHLRLDIKHRNSTIACDVLLSEISSWAHWIHFRLVDTHLQWRRMHHEMGKWLLVCQKNKVSWQPYVHRPGVAHS